MKVYLAKKDAKANYHRNRQKSVRYKSKAKNRVEKKKSEQKAAEKKSKKRNHDYDTEKSCYAPAKKKVKVSDVIYNENDVTFHDFKVDGVKIWYRGEVSAVHTVNGAGKYDVLFDDDELGKDMTARILRQAPPKGAKQYHKNKNLL